MSDAPVKQVGEIGNFEIQIAVVLNEKENSELLREIGIIDPASWNKTGNISQQSFFAPGAALCIFGMEKYSSHTEDEYGKMLEIACGGFYKDLQKKLGDDLGIHQLAFQGFLAEEVLTLYKERIKQ